MGKILRLIRGKRGLDVQRKKLFSLLSAFGGPTITSKVCEKEITNSFIVFLIIDRK